MAIEQLVVERSKKCEIFSNPLRMFIMLVLFVRPEISWSELKSNLERSIGGVNPNTLNFHVGRLIETGFLDKVDIEGQPKYRINETKVSEIESMVGEDLVERMQETLGS